MKKMKTVFLIFFSLHGLSTEINLDDNNKDGHFERALNSPHYADKSRLIKHLLETFLTASKEKMLVVNAPPGFGKSTNLDMLKTFLERQVNSDGTFQKRLNPPNRGFFADRELNVYKDRPFFERHFGKYPILHLNLNKVFMPNQRSDSLMTSIIELLRKQHSYLSTSWLAPQSLLYNSSSFKKCLKFFLEDMSHFFNQTCIVLIDANETPDTGGLLNGRISNDRHGVGEFMKNVFYKELIENEKVSRVIAFRRITGEGTYNPSHPSKNIKHLSVFEDERLSKYFGFTQDEIITFIQKKILEPKAGKDGKNDESDPNEEARIRRTRKETDGGHEQNLVQERRKDFLKQIQYWYGGYKVKNSRDQLYSFSSVSKYLTTGVFQPYLTKPANFLDSELLFQFKFLGPIVEEAIENELPTTMTEGLETGSLQNTTSSGLFQNKGNLFTRQTVLQYLTEYGFFAANYINDDRFKQRWGSEFKNDRIVCIRVPNFETVLELTKGFIQHGYYKQKYKVSEQTQDFFIGSIRGLRCRKGEIWSLGKSIAHIFSYRKPNSEAELVGALFALALESEAFKMVKRPVAIETKKESVHLYICRKLNRPLFFNFAYNEISSEKALERAKDDILDFGLSEHSPGASRIGYYFTTKGFWSLTHSSRNVSCTVTSNYKIRG